VAGHAFMDPSQGSGWRSATAYVTVSPNLDIYMTNPRIEILMRGDAVDR